MEYAPHRDTCRTRVCAVVIAATLVSGAAAALGANGDCFPPGFAPLATVGPERHVTAPAAAVLVNPGADLQNVVDAEPPGTTFYLAAGVYRAQQVRPRGGDTFIGAYGATLNGSVLVSGFARAGEQYVATQSVAPGFEVNGVCQPEFPRCKYPHTAFLDGQPLIAVASLGLLRNNRQFYYDYATIRLFLHDDPAGKTVELAYSPFAFGGRAPDVSIRNLIVEKYASADQQGAIGNHGEGAGWLISHNEVGWNHGYGVAQGSTSKALANYIHHNGEMGIGGGSGNRGSLVQGNEIAFNAWNGTNCSWECGGGKWGNVTALSVIGNYVHDNQGDGLWTDEASSKITYRKNLIANNARAGISHEISFDCLIAGNFFIGNGKTTYRWGWSAEIQVQNSSNTEVAHNTIVLDPVLGGIGIAVIQQNRGPRYVPRNDYVHHNRIQMAGDKGIAAGWFADFDPTGFGRDRARFDFNTYVVGGTAARSAWMNNELTSFVGWQSAGHDPHGALLR